MIKTKLTSACFGLIAAVSAHASPVPESLFAGLPDDVTPALSASGTYAVGVQTHSVSNPQSFNPLAPSPEGRELQFEVWYPALKNSGEKATYLNQTRSGIPFAIQGEAFRDASANKSGERYPVVVLSHGYTGYRTIMFHLGEHLASHGYLVVGIDHTDSRNEDINFASAPFAGFVSTLVNRAKDQQFALDWVTQSSAYADIASNEVAGVIGYSMGGYGAINTIGGCYGFTPAHIAAISGNDDTAANTQLADLINQCAAGREQGADPRWQAAMLLAPWGGNHQVFTSASLAQIKVPSLYVSGSLDDISGYDGIRWLYEQHQNEHTRLLTFENARHNIGPHPSPSVAKNAEIDIGHYHDASWDAEVVAAVNQHFALAMMDCYLKQSVEGCQYLSVSGSSNQKAANGKTPEPWIGFDHRYSTGLIMESQRSE